MPDAPIIAAPAIAASVVLASASQTRAAMLRAAGLEVAPHPMRLDEDAIRLSLASEGLPPRDIAAELADAKASRAASRHPEAWVIAADQVLDLDGTALGKPETSAAARDRLQTLAAKAHRLHTAVSVYHQGRRVWSVIDSAQLTMRPLAPDWIDRYLARIGDEALETPGCYRIEALGIQLFERIEGDHFTILGLPLLPLLAYLRLRGVIA